MYQFKWLCSCGGSGGNNVQRTPLVRTVDAPGVQHSGYVLAMFLPVQGAPLVNGRQYPMMLRGEMWYVHPDDIAYRPNWWQPAEVAENA